MEDKLLPIYFEYIVQTELDEKKQYILKSYFQEGKTCKQIGETLEITVSAVSLKIRELYREFLTGRYYEILNNGFDRYVESVRTQGYEEGFERGYRKGYDSAVDSYKSSDNNSAETMPIEMLDLSVRAYNALKRSGLNTVGEVVRKGSQVKKLRNCGQRTYQEIVEALEKHHVTF